MKFSGHAAALTFVPAAPGLVPGRAGRDEPRPGRRECLRRRGLVFRPPHKRRHESRRGRQKYLRHVSGSGCGDLRGSESRPKQEEFPRHGRKVA